MISNPRSTCAGFNGQPVTTTVVFVDGVRINEPDFNTINFDLIPIEDIERIEILPGTATVFGRNALGGVINITTKRGRTEAPRFGVSIGGGSFSRQKYGFSTDGLLPFGNLDYYFGVYERADRWLSGCERRKNHPAIGKTRLPSRR